MVKNSSSFKENMMLGFSLGIGFNLASLIFIFFGALFFFAGLIILSNQKKKPEGQKNKSLVYLAYGLMILGCIVGLGFGAGYLIDSVANGDNF